MSAEDKQVVDALDMRNPINYRILNMLNLGLGADEIATVVGCSVDRVRKISQSPESTKHIETIQRLARCMTEVARTQFDELQTLGIRTMYEVLESDKATYDQKMRAALAIFDRHPDGQFVKTAKNINKEEVEVGLSNDTMRPLKKIADKTNAAIDITPLRTPEAPSGRALPAGPESDSQQTPATSFDDAIELHAVQADYAEVM